MSTGITNRNDASLEDKRIDEMFAVDEKGKAKKVDVPHSDVLINQQLMNDAVDGENREHEMTMLTAVKEYPWACFWGFIMCFTIVSPLPRFLGFAPVPSPRTTGIRVIWQEHR